MNVTKLEIIPAVMGGNGMFEVKLESTMTRDELKDLTDELTREE